MTVFSAQVKATLLAVAALCLCDPFIPCSFAQEINGNLSAEPASLDPAHADDEYSYRILSNVLQGLVGYDGDGKIVWELAESVATKKGGTEYVFTIRKGAKWSDGTPVTPRDFIFSFRRLLNPKTGAKLSDMFFGIKNAREVYAGTLEPKHLGVSERDGKLVFDLVKPIPYFLHLLTQPQASALREDVIEKNGGAWPEGGPATGPYRISSHALGQELRLEPNLSYWRAGLHLAPVILRIVTDEATALRLFESKKLDFISRVPLLDLDRLRKLGVVRDYPQVGTYFLSFNARIAPFNDRTFRRAVAACIDRDGILKAMGTANAPAWSWVPPGLEGNQPYRRPNDLFRDSLESAKKALKEHPQTVQGAFNSADMNFIIMQKIQSDLKACLGLDLELTNMDWSTYTGLVRTKTPQIYRYTRGAPFLDSIWHLQSFVGGDANNPTGWDNPEYDRLVNEISTMPSGSRRLREIVRAQAILTDEDAIVIPVFYFTQTYLVSPKLKGFKVNPMGATLFEEVSF